MAFPFEMLHMEMVRYAKERHKERVNDLPNEVIDGLDKHTSAIVHKAMTQYNAETSLESMGFRIGFSLAERVSKDLPKMSTELEIMKFICKEFWSSAFGKQVDNLRTNHQGVYVVQDNKLNVVVPFGEGSQYLKEAVIYLAVPCGMVRGALAALGITAIVSPTTDCLPAVKFHIQIPQRN